MGKASKCPLHKIRKYCKIHSTGQLYSVGYEAHRPYSRVQTHEKLLQTACLTQMFTLNKVFFVVTLLTVFENWVISLKYKNYLPILALNFYKCLEL